jgi:hypothetical protein
MKRLADAEVAAAFLLILCSVSCETENAGSRPMRSGSGSMQSSPAAASNVQVFSIPQDEQRFIDTVFYFQARYRNAANEYEQSRIRRNRDMSLVRLVPYRTVNQWIGIISSMQTTSDGNGILSVTLWGASSISIKTWNNSLSDIGSGTLIPGESLLYEQVSGLNLGDAITFSGTFSPERGYLNEKSVTERGSIEAPEFIFAFSAIHPGVPSTQPDGETKTAQAVPVQAWTAPSPASSSAPSRVPEVTPGPIEPSETPQAAPAPVAPAPIPIPRSAPAFLSPTAGVLHAIVEVEHGDAVFDNLPAAQLKFTFDHDAWQATIRKQPNGTKTLVMHSLKPGSRITCDVRWEIMR